jgi:hypothetical protein|tara:strand:- start:44 stop:412 length:369 start_codon:yes stop_codon:yes gene_type:complete
MIDNRLNETTDVREIALQEHKYQDTILNLAWTSLNTNSIGDNHRRIIFDVVIDFGMQQDFANQLKFWKENATENSRQYNKVEDCLMEFQSYRISQGVCMPENVEKKVLKRKADFWNKQNASL